MLKLAMVLGVAILLISVLVAVSPEPLLSAEDMESRGTLYSAAAFRLVMGLVLILAAPPSRCPTGLRIIGALAILGGLVLPFLPTDVWAGLVRWWTVEHLTLYRTVGSTVGMLLGAFIAYAAWPKRAAASQGDQP